MYLAENRVQLYKNLDKFENINLDRREGVAFFRVQRKYDENEQPHPAGRWARGDGRFVRRAYRRPRCALRERERESRIGDGDGGAAGPTGLLYLRTPPFGVFFRSFIHSSTNATQQRDRGVRPLHLCLPSSASPPTLPSPSKLRRPPPSRPVVPRRRHGLAGHHPHGHRHHRQWNRPGALPVPSADLLPHLEEEDGGAVLGGAVPGHAAQLHDVGALRPPGGAPAQHARHHHQRHRHGHRARLHRALPRLLRRRRTPPGPLHPRRRGRLRRRRRRARPQPRPQPRPQVHGRRHPLRPLRHRHVRRAALRHENGDPDQERGVHAPVPVTGLARQRHLLDCLRPHQVRPLHHHPQRAGRDVRGGAGGPLRHLLQVDAGDPGGPQAQGRPDTHDRGRRRREDRRIGRRQRTLLGGAKMIVASRVCIHKYLS